MSCQRGFSVPGRIGGAITSAAFAGSSLVGCTGHTSTPNTGSAPSAIARAAVHPTRPTLVAALPSSADLTWLPSGVTASRDIDLTDQLGFVGCSAAPHIVATNRTSATNITFHLRSERVAEITFYDVDSVDDAALFMSGTRAFLRCPNQGEPVSTSLVPLAAPTACEDTLALRTLQPEGSSIDAWCRVGNLVGLIRLDPQGIAAPTVAQGIATIDAVGMMLGSLFA
jgi:hypothetical protein